MARTCYTGNLLKLTRNKEEANTMLNALMNAMCRFARGFISLYHSILKGICTYSDWYYVNETE